VASKVLTKYKIELSFENIGILSSAFELMVSLNLVAGLKSQN
jgi:hypothetical protein